MRSGSPPLSLIYCSKPPAPRDKAAAISLALNVTFSQSYSWFPLITFRCLLIFILFFFLNVKRVFKLHLNSPANPSFAALSPLSSLSSELCLPCAGEMLLTLCHLLNWERINHPSVLFTRRAFVIVIYLPKEHRFCSGCISAASEAPVLLFYCTSPSSVRGNHGCLDFFLYLNHIERSHQEC